MYHNLKRVQINLLLNKKYNTCVIFEVKILLHCYIFHLFGISTFYVNFGVSHIGKSTNAKSTQSLHANYNILICVFDLNFHSFIYTRTLKKNENHVGLCAFTCQHKYMAA